MVRGKTVFFFRGSEKSLRNWESVKSLGQVRRLQEKSIRCLDCYQYIRKEKNFKRL